MEKTRELIEAFDYHCEAMPIELTCVVEGRGQGYTLNETGGKAVVKAHGKLGALYGLYQTEVAIRSGHLPDFIGENNPRFRLRPVAFRSDEQYAISSDTALAIPECMRSRQQIEALCVKLLQLGYNAVILGGGKADLPKSETVDLKKSLAIFKEYGLRLIVQPTALQGTIRQTIDQLFQFYSETDGIFWESGDFHPSHLNSPDETSYDLALSELNEVENSLPREASLIYYLRSFSSEEALLQSQWFPMFCDDAGDQTAIAFDSVLSDTAHPFWNALRASPDTSATPLLPIMNLEEEGPILSLDLMQQYLPRCRRHRFPGIISRAGKIPVIGSFAHGNLWILGQALWRELSPVLLAESWFAAFRGEIDSSAYLTAALPLLREMAKNKNTLRKGGLSEPEESLLRSQIRCLSESIRTQLPHLKELKEFLEKDL